jgi:hypothetical protein
VAGVGGDPAALADLAHQLRVARDALRDATRMAELDARESGHPAVASGLRTVASGVERQRDEAADAAAVLAAYVAAASRALQAADGTIVTVQVRR